MSTPPYQTYPHHHPHHGRPYVVVHNHDVLCGRGVNIAQHPGNERFRALVNTRHDESYCTTFTTSEKRALAEEIINHIMVLDPPGRFLKRSGRSQSSRGLNGPWEELTYRECVKKTCQALRDCNRTDRIGYAAQVAVPEDVKESADQRVQSGLSLKEHAAAAVAKANPPNLHPHHLNLNPPPLDHYPPGTTDTASHISRKRYSNNSPGSGSAERLSPSVENAAEWLKKQRTDDPLPCVANSYQHSNEGVPSIFSSTHSTPTPHVAPVPVTTTPVSQQYAQLLPHHTDPIPLSHHTTSPQMPSPTSFHQDSQGVATTAACTAPYSPVALLTPQAPEEHSMDAELGHPSPQDLDCTHFADQQSYSNHHESQPFHTDLSHQPSADVLQSAADAVAAFINNPAHDNGFSLVCGDEVPHESLGINDL